MCNPIRNVNNSIALSQFYGPFEARHDREDAYLLPCAVGGVVSEFERIVTVEKVIDAEVERLRMATSEVITEGAAQIGPDVSRHTEIIDFVVEFQCHLLVAREKARGIIAGRHGFVMS